MYLQSNDYRVPGGCGGEHVQRPWGWRDLMVKSEVTVEKEGQRTGE